MKPTECPHCKAPLSDQEIRSLWASRNGKRQTKHAGPGYTKAMRAAKASAEKRRGK
jgi:ribosomal protein L37AE/L43A